MAERFTEDVRSLTASQLYTEHRAIQRMFDDGTEGDAAACFMRMFEIEEEFDRRREPHQQGGSMELESRREWDPNPLPYAEPLE